MLRKTVLSLFAFLSFCSIASALPYKIPYEVRTLNGKVIYIWNLNEGTGSTAYEVGGSTSGTLNGCTYVRDGYGISVSFNGTSNWIDLGNKDFYDQFPYSVGAVFRMAPGVAPSDSMGSLWGNGGMRKSLYISADYRITAEHYPITGNAANITQSNANEITPGKIEFAGYIADGNAVTLMHGTTAVMVANVSGSITFYDALNTNIGGSVTDYNFPGNIYSVFYTSSALTRNEWNYIYKMTTRLCQPSQ